MEMRLTARENYDASGGVRACFTAILRSTEISTVPKT